MVPPGSTLTLLGLIPSTGLLMGKARNPVRPHGKRRDSQGQEKPLGKTHRRYSRNPDRLPCNAMRCDGRSEPVRIPARQITSSLRKEVGVTDGARNNPLVQRLMAQAE
jgi:hypothetical protein